ncbi:putative cold-shock DNA-binding protein [Roseivirga pacifica]|uniref:Cold-shock DNA-binding protein family n=1 Tax=Roseivirga pacifica TaxID=1267423 RepID=A0A1I0Q462_9BACT|nr:cold shock domain-containing protein [Roseivirga pacifica]MCO6360502.1 cold shock domain-containing protein [Roseivirga pacifica]MCO6368391.1 cold shock domain-containing protein [Roseivirga pacifica]MCO6372533.1 cold shock domain-containing protein [Roseivirga pacifica]MCO6376591.1 cold shock domain-containing protein [Roseivirga pacifica]MCO6378129.1 cold shock domain-containing protein [Roseivirga pacifica]
MAKSQQTFSKKEKEKKKLQKRKEKQLKKEERKANATDGTLENMMAYVDEFGNITDTPPDPTQKKKEVKASSIEIGVPKQEEEDLSTERRGRVAFFNDSKGYGFINQDGSQDRFFVHVNGLKEPIQEGDRVRFSLEKGPKGMNAIEVTKV